MEAEKLSVTTNEPSQSNNKVSENTEPTIQGFDSKRKMSTLSKKDALSRSLLPPAENNTQELIDRMAFQMLQDEESMTQTDDRLKLLGSTPRRKRKRSLDESGLERESNSFTSRTPSPLVTLHQPQNMRQMRLATLFQQHPFISQFLQENSHSQGYSSTRNENASLETQIQHFEHTIHLMKRQNQSLWELFAQQRATLQSLAQFSALGRNVYIGDLRDLPEFMLKHITAPHSMPISVVTPQLQFYATSETFREMVQCHQSDFQSKNLTLWHFETTTMPYEVSLSNMQGCFMAKTQHISCTTTWCTKFNREIIVFHESTFVYDSPVPFCWTVSQVVQQFDTRIRFDSDEVIVDEEVHETNKRFNSALSRCTPLMFDVLIKRAFHRRVNPPKIHDSLMSEHTRLI